MDIKEINIEITKLCEKRKEFEEVEWERFLKRAAQNVGRCFKTEDIWGRTNYVKIINIPQNFCPFCAEYGPDYYRGAYYPAIYLIPDFKSLDVEDSRYPIDYRFMAFKGWGGKYEEDNGCEEITQEEFEDAFNNLFNVIKDSFKPGYDNKWIYH